MIDETPGRVHDGLTSGARYPAAGAVSLRRVARDAGVTSGAPYHHFADRSALLAAIAVRGSELLEASLRDAVAQAPTAITALGRLVETYVDFARGHAGYVHVMLRPELSPEELTSRISAPIQSLLAKPRAGR